MKLEHFHTYQPGCPVCRSRLGEHVPVKIAHVWESEAATSKSAAAENRRSALTSSDEIEFGSLLCTNADCQREFPIIDGIPLLIADLRGYLSQNVLAVTGRTDLPAAVESILGDACGPGSEWDTQRQQLSSYIWDHFGEFDPAETEATAAAEPGYPRPGGVARAVREGLSAAGELLPGPWLDLGCSVGRVAWELSQLSDELVLGVDLNLAKLRWASRVIRTGQVKYARRRVGLVYDHREFTIDHARQRQVDFWACDVAALPLAQGVAANAMAFNVLDCVHSPQLMLAGLADVLRSGGKAVVSCPYDWSAAATPIECWLGGHSQRAEHSGSSEWMVAEAVKRVAGGRLDLLAAADGPPWHVRLHDRSTMLYRNHRLILQVR